MNTEIKNDVIDQLIIQVTLIDPITDILNKLKATEFRDCDIKWLNEKLNKFTTFAAETLGYNNHLFPELDYPYLNDLVKDKFTEYFTTLLSYFKSYLD